MSGEWRGTLWTLLVTFCIVIIRCTETFWSPCIMSNGMFHGVTCTGQVWCLLKTIDELYHTTLTMGQKCICISLLLNLLLDNDDFYVLFVTNCCWEQSQACNRLPKCNSKARIVPHPSVFPFWSIRRGAIRIATHKTGVWRINTIRIYQTLRSNLGLEAGYIDQGLPYYFPHFTRVCDRITN